MEGEWCSEAEKRAQRRCKALLRDVQDDLMSLSPSLPFPPPLYRNACVFTHIYIYMQIVILRRKACLGSPNHRKTHGPATKLQIVILQRKARPGSPNHRKTHSPATKLQIATLLQKARLGSPNHRKTHRPATKMQIAILLQRARPGSPNHRKTHRRMPCLSLWQGPVTIEYDEMIQIYSFITFVKSAVMY